LPSEVKLVFFLTAVFHVMPESANNRLLSHAVATTRRPAKCLKSPLQIKVLLLK
jgi:hypothetical protein